MAQNPHRALLLARRQDLKEQRSSLEERVMRTADALKIQLDYKLLDAVSDLPVDKISLLHRDLIKDLISLTTKENQLSDIEAELYD